MMTEPGGGTARRSPLGMTAAVPVAHGMARKAPGC